MGTPANFNGLRVSALEYWALATLCGVEQRAPLIFGRADMTLGIGPHSSFSYVSMLVTVPFMPHRNTAYVRMPPIVTDGVAWSVGLSVCLSVCHDREPCKNRRTDRDTVWVENSGGPKVAHVSCGVHIGATWRIRLNRPCAVAMRPFCQMTFTACLFPCV